MNKKQETANIRLSVLDIERKYTVDPAENVYSGGKYVSWGPDNNFPALLNTCYSKSSTLHSVINSRVDYILGDDVVVSPDAAYWQEKVDRYGTTMRQLVAKLAYNKSVYGSFAIQVIYNKLGLPVELYALDFGRIRISEDRRKVYYSKKWSKYQTKAEEYDAWDPGNLDMSNPTQIYVEPVNFLSSFYPMPPYAGSIDDILTEIECSKYALNSVSKGFSAKFVLNFPETNVTNEQKQGIEEAIKSKFCGSEADSNFLLYWYGGDSSGEKLEVAKIENDETPERFLAIKDSARQNIFVAMRTSPLLCGLPMASAFSTNEFRDSFKLYQRTVVQPLQTEITDAISKVTGIPDAVAIKPFNVSFEDEANE